MNERDHAEDGAEGGVENEVQEQVGSLFVHIRFIALFNIL